MVDPMTAVLADDCPNDYYGRHGVDASWQPVVPPATWSTLDGMDAIDHSSRNRQDRLELMHNPSGRRNDFKSSAEDMGS
jgi:hypothetical protein